MEEKILDVHDLHVSFHTDDGVVQAVRGVDFSLNREETLAIVGESGSGKSVTAKAIMKLLPKDHVNIPRGRVLYRQKDILHIPLQEMQKIRGSEISMVFQDPMTSLNPTMKIGKQIMEGIIKHEKLTRSEAKKRAIHMLALVGIPDAERRVHMYPHQFSGGMRQRVVIAMALACYPKVLIADEPTTALDVTIQAQILELMKTLQKKTGTAIMMITHDLGVVAKLAHRVAVMYAGEIVELGNVHDIFYQPKHPYTWGLLQSMPKLHAPKSSPLIPIPGSPPNLAHIGNGCPFADRCRHVMKVCRLFSPPETVVSSNHTVRCWLQDERAPKQSKSPRVHLSPL